MKRATLAALVMLTVLLAGAPSALAYSELSRFGETTDLGGGDGHWFTGSPGDGYTCAVCHEGKTRGMPVTITGLPDRYQPGAAYEVLLSWPATLEHVSALIEFTDEHGAGAGSILLPGETTMPMSDADTCQPVGLGIPAAERFSAPDANVTLNRQLIGVADDCGVHQLRLQWTAPQLGAATMVFFSGGVVQSDEKQDLLGDGVLELSRPILPAAQPAYVVETKGGCAVASVSTAHARSASRATAAGLWFMVAIGLINRLRRRRR